MVAAGHPAPTVSVLVLNRNGREHLEHCLPSLERQTYPSGRCELVVVDNASSDDSLEWVRRHHPGVRVLSFAENRGFAAAYNAAVESSDADFVAFLNNDTRVEADWLAELVAAAERHGAASAGSKMLDWSGRTVDFAGGLVSLFGHSWQRDEGLPAANASHGRSRAVRVRRIDAGRPEDLPGGGRLRSGFLRVLRGCRSRMAAVALRLRQRARSQRHHLPPPSWHLRPRGALIEAPSLRAQCARHDLQELRAGHARPRPAGGGRSEHGPGLSRSSLESGELRDERPSAAGGRRIAPVHRPSHRARGVRPSSCRP